MLQTILQAGAAGESMDILSLILGASPVVMGVLGLVTLWAGIASWRRNHRAGLHTHDVAGSPGESVDDQIAPGTPLLADPPTAAESPHRRRRRRRPGTDGG